jgi:hypothetical protein
LFIIPTASSKARHFVELFDPEVVANTPRYLFTIALIDVER